MRAKAATQTVRAILMAIFMVLLAASAHAENWARVFEEPGTGEGGEAYFVEIDTESIHRAADGRVHYDSQDDMYIPMTIAVSCEERTHQLVGNGQMLTKPELRSIVPGSPEAAEADFVCGRV